MDRMFVGGRIEFLGKHTDYGGGRSLVCAIDKGFTVESNPTENGLVKIVNKDSDEVITFPLDENLTIQSNHWANYPQTVAKRAAKNFKSQKLNGVEIKFTSNLPQAAGVSSSSALIVATFLALSKAANLTQFEEYQNNISDKFALGNYLGCVENGYDFRDLKGNKGVGTFGGSQDQTAIICGKENQISQFSFCPVRHEGDFPLSRDYRFVIAASGVIAEKTGAALTKYNRLSLMSQEIIKKFDQKLSLAQVIEKYGLEKVKAKLESQDLVNRLTQFYLESYEIIPQVSALLAEQKIEYIGDLIDKSHRNADEMLGNQTVETNFLQETARKFGAIASSAFGAGFGGSVYALVRTTMANNFMEVWREQYLNRFAHLKPEFFITKPSQSQY